jgi:hypothetical protein
MNDRNAYKRNSNSYKPVKYCSKLFNMTELLERLSGYSMSSTVVLYVCVSVRLPRHSRTQRSVMEDPINDMTDKDMV